jgi:hypothetical protein
MYSTGGNGSYEATDNEEILTHRLPLTVERGAWLDDAVHRAHSTLPATGIAHVHVTAGA